VPCVLTPAQARRLGWVHGRDILVAETAAEFAAACIELHASQLLWEGLCANARARLAEECARSRFDAVIRQIVAEAAARR
jgi:hypothetical protein